MALGHPHDRPRESLTVRTWRYNASVSQTLIAVAGTLGGVALTGLISLRMAARARNDQRRDELAAALAAFGYALDRLRKEFDAMPPPPRRAGRVVERAASRWFPTVDWWVGQIVRHTTARPALRAHDAVMAATNRLLLVAPEQLLDHVVAIIELLDRARPHDEDWQAQWLERRAELLRASRSLVSS